MVSDSTSNSKLELKSSSFSYLHLLKSNLKFGAVFLEFYVPLTMLSCMLWAMML